jgi:hypothetical protein
VILLALLLPLGLAAEQPQERASTRSPHGPLNIACQSCHTNLSWKPIRAFPDFDHNKTAYPLRGMHAAVGCNQCHIKAVFTDVGHKCAECHADIHRGQMGAKCESCHSVKGWQVSIKDIQQHQNRFPLIGAHATLTCDSCHTGAATGQFAGLSTACVSCHQTDFAKTTNPNHTAVGFPTECQDCHSMNSWLGAQFDHAKFTGFALTGAHAKLECSACHANNNFTTAQTNCVSCHLNDFNSTNNPNHRAAGFSQDCSTCHNTSSWLTATFNHNLTKFPLTGAHVNVACTQCHVGGQFSSTPTDCNSCHNKDFQATNNPPHVSAGFPTDCSVCHSTASWAGATFDHSKTAFPLTGAHTSLTCNSCHASGKFVGLSTACVSCHLANFQGAKNPDHVAAGFPTDCQVCHNTSAWMPSSFDHSKTAFPLTGAHTTVACSNCHVNGQYASTPTDCYSCHKAAYQSTTDPNHVTAAFPTTCQTCHNTTAWTGATFNHTWFPIYSGTHQGKWTTCADCHANSANYASFTCTSCHTHNQTDTDAHHRNVRNYVYSSPNCYSCHPSGRAG